VSERSTPREVGLSVGVGVFCGCTPFVGLHMWIALAAATVLRLNRLWSFVGSRVSFSVVYLWLTFTEIELAHRLRFGAWAPLAPRDALGHGRELIGDWFLGCVLVGLPLAVALGLATYLAMRRRADRAPSPVPLPGEAPPPFGLGLTDRTPGEPLPPTSESPRSAPPAPTR
jgi:uncharacterized protein (DUF2062 family)